MSVQARLPDVVVVVLDCGRSFDFPAGPEPVSGTPFLDSLRSEAVVFPQAASPSAWTVPGHASLFTGLYPWEHRVHMKSQLKLAPGVPTIASRLKERGYATLSLSANGFVGPDFGLLSGFEAAAWGTWWEKFLRLPDLNLPLQSTWKSNASNPPGQASESATPLTVSGHDLPMGFGTRLVHPFVEGKDPVWMGPAVNLLNFGIQRLRPRGPGSPLAISPWIEPTLVDWLNHQPRERPVFCFINFLELHEPYVADSFAMSNLFTWGRFALQRTDKSNFYAGRWRPSGREFARLRTLYRSSLVSLDARLNAVAKAFRAAGRWNDSLFILTADHGQAFGEHGYLFHAARVWEPVVRIPMWVRWPRGRGGGHAGTGWASLIDVAPTVFEAAGIPTGTSPAAHSLTTLIDRPRAEPLYTMADGLQGKTIIQKVAPECVEQWDTPWVAAYHNGEKLLFDVAHDRWLAYRVGEDPQERRDVFASLERDDSGLVEGIRSVASQLTAGPPALINPEVDALLRSWGYD
jgi:arylsulfatase A-like enzyme